MSGRGRPKTVQVPDWRAFYGEQTRCELTMAEVWIERVAELERQGKTVRHYTGRWKHAIGPAFGSMTAREITPAMVAAFLEAMKAGGYSNGTTRTTVSMLSMMFELAMRLGAADLNPVKNLPHGAIPPKRLVQPQRSALEVLDLEQVGRILGAEFVPFGRRLLYALALLTGCRVGEVAALQWGDYRANKEPLGELVVSRSWDCKRHRFSPTKTGTTRYVPVHPRLAAYLEQARAWWRFQFGREPGDEDLICPSEASRTQPGSRTPTEGPVPRPIAAGTALQWWRRDLESIGIDEPPTGPRRFHSTRHTFVNLLRRAGVERDVGMVITHSVGSSRDAYDIYVHHDWRSLCAAVLKIDL